MTSSDVNGRHGHVTINDENETFAGADLIRGVEVSVAPDTPGGRPPHYSIHGKPRGKETPTNP